MHSRALHAANVLGAVVDVLARDLAAAMAASASGPGGRAAAVTALAGFASGRRSMHWTQTTARRSIA
jgi:hypothetical protein